MIPKYYHNEHVKFISQTQAVDHYGQPTGIYIPAFTHAIAEFYDKKGTEENTSDDLVEVKITQSPKPELIGREFWVKSSDFIKLGRD